MVNESDSTDVEEQIDKQALADVALVVEALAAFAGHPESLDTRRERRAWELISDLAGDLGMTPSEVLHVNAHIESRYS